MLILITLIFLEMVEGNQKFLNAMKIHSRVDLERINYLRLAFIYTFPNITNCLQTALDGSEFSEELLIRIGKHDISPALVQNIKAESYDCKCYLLLCQELTAFAKNLIKLPKWADHRILCIINEGTIEELENFLKTNTSLFGDAQIMVVLLSNIHPIGYKLDQPIRTFEKLRLDNGSWKSNVDGVLDFHGREIKIATFNCSIYSRFGPVNEKGQPSYFDGYEFHLFKEIVGRINATYRILPHSVNEKYGFYVNGTYINGTLGKVIAGQADLGFCGHLIESNKVPLNLEMSAPFQLICFKYAVHRPPEVSGNLLEILRPFTHDTWIILITSTICVSGGLLILAKITYKLKFETKKYGRFGNCLLTLLGILLLGSWPKMKTKLGPIRHILAWWVVFTLLLTNGYTSILVSQLATTKYSKKDNHIQEFLDNGYFWPKTTMPYLGIFDMRDPKYINWIKRVQIVNDQSHLNYVLKREIKSVVLTQQISTVNALFGEIADEDVLEDFETVDHCLTSLYEGFLFRMGSPFNKAFNFYIRHLRETGITDHKFERVIQRLCKGRNSFFTLSITRGNTKTSSKPLKIENLNGIFDFLGLGLTISFIVFMMEKLHYKIKNNKK